MSMDQRLLKIILENHIVKLKFSLSEPTAVSFSKPWEENSSESLFIARREKDLFSKN